MSIRIRRMTALDATFVRDSWRDSYRMSHMAGPIPMSMYDDVYESVLRLILERPDVQVHVAYSTNQRPPDDILGWICTERDAWTRVKGFDTATRQYVDRDVQLEQPLVHYVNVKQPCRRQGLARELFTSAGVDPARPWTYTFSTALVAKLKQRREWRGTFDPRLARFPKRQLPKHEPTEE